MATYTLERDGLIAGDSFAPTPVTVAASQTIVRGQVLSFSSGAVSACAADGTPFGVAAADITTSATETTKSIPVYQIATLNKNALVYASGTTDAQKATILAALRNIGIITTSIVEA